jgi:hypothetical protein
VIEDNKSTGESYEVRKRTNRAPKDRKPKYESRATEFRQRLVVWKQTPASMRQSLRALAGELGTSHQLLAHYLDGLEEWQYKERAAGRKRKQRRFAHVQRPRTGK